MIVRKILLVACAAALMSTPAWALPGQAPSNRGTAHAPSTTPVGPPSTTPNNTDNPGAANRSQHDDHSGEKGAPHKGDHRSDNPDHSNNPSNPSHPGQSHKCKPHNVAYVASGTLVSQTLTKNADGTYSGEVSVEVKHTNHHAAGDKGMTKTYKVENVHVTFGLADTNNDGSVGLDDIRAGDRVKLIGKITALAKKCSQSGFAATTTIRRIVFHAPLTAGSS